MALTTIPMLDRFGAGDPNALAKALAFRSEVKTAAMGPQLHGALSGAGAIGGVGALAGGLVGGYKSFRDARARGDDAVGALLDAGRGAGRGALIGGVGGAALGAGAGAALPRLGEQVANMPGLGVPARFAQRQVHSVTGWTPRGGLEAIGGGAQQARQNLDGARRGVQDAARGVESAQVAQDAGLTSIPGFARSFVKDPGGTLRKGYNEWKDNNGPGMKMLAVGAPALEAVHAATSKEEPGGPGKAERVGRALLPAVGGLVTGPMAMAGQLAVGSALGAAGAGAGRLVDRLRGRRAIEAAPPRPREEPPTGAPEHIVGPGMMNGPGSEGSS